MAQKEVGEFWACSLLDLYGWDSVPAGGSAPAVAAGRARLYYNSSDNTIHVTNSLGQELLGTGAVNSVFGRTGVVTAQAGDYSGFYTSLDNVAPEMDLPYPGVQSVVVKDSLQAGDLMRITSQGFGTDFIQLFF